jgi:catechol 2,3-dioxygenase-like lactoylglutathione lyase family enzyme
MKLGTVGLAAQTAFVALMPWMSAAAQTDDSNPLKLVPDHATASVADLDKESAWYGRVLGFREVSRFQGPDFEVRHLGIPGYRIDLAWQKGSSRNHAAKSYQQQGWLHVVFRTDTLEADYRRLMELGTDVRADKNSESRVSRLILHDPEGNELEIVPTQPSPP